jgi:hypothetical protein
MCETNPIGKSVGGGRPTYQEPIVRNKARLRRIGACGQRRSSCAGHLRREVECAKRSQFSPAWGDADQRKMRNEPDSARSNAPNEANSAGQVGPRRARYPLLHHSTIPIQCQSCDIASMPRFGKQSQFLDCGLRIVQNEPNSGRGEPPGVPIFHHSNPMPIVRHHLDAPLRETKPIGRRGAVGGDILSFWYSIIPPSRSEGDVRKTNPIVATNGRSRAGTPKLRRAEGKVDRLGGGS